MTPMGQKQVFRLIIDEGTVSMKKYLAIALIFALSGVCLPNYAKGAMQEEIQSVSPVEAEKGEGETSAPLDEETPLEEDISPQTAEVMVPIFNYEITDVVVPASYALSLNPYEMPIDMGDGSVSTQQVLSRKYGIVNKSSMDKLVTVTFTVEDMNKDKIVFVDSAKEAENADEDTYAVYLALVPADEKEVKIGKSRADEKTSAQELSNVEMNGAKRQAVALHEGENKVSFKLSKAAYDFKDGDRPELGSSVGKDEKKAFELTGLNPKGKSVTAFTFEGAMNQKAAWEKLSKGIRITASYVYKTADGTEKIVKGTGAMVIGE